MRKFISTVIVIVFLGMLNPGAEELKVIKEENGKVLVEAEGILTKVKMTNFDWNPWEEYALQDEDGELSILIGEKAEELKDLIGEKITVRGLLKPPFKVKGQETRTVEIQEIVK